jgi:hypothetical protein
MLTIPEEVLLLHGALWPKRAYALADQQLAAARLIELVLADRVTVQSHRQHLLVRDNIVVTHTTPTGDALLDEVLKRIAGADLRSCAYWIKRVAKGSEAAYWDRLTANSLLRPDPLSGDAARHMADVDAVAAVTDRIGAVLAQPQAADLRDAALVTLLAHTQSLFGLLHEPGKLTPSGFVRGYRAQQRDDRMARRALNPGRAVPAARPAGGGAETSG